MTLVNDYNGTSILALAEHRLVTPDREFTFFLREEGVSVPAKPRGGLSQIVASWCRALNETLLSMKLKIVDVSSLFKALWARFQPSVCARLCRALIRGLPRVFQMLVFTIGNALRILLFPLANGVRITVWRFAVLFASVNCIIFTLGCLYMHTWVAGRASGLVGGIDVEKWHVGLFGELIFDTPWKELPRDILLGLDDYFQGRIVTT